MALEAFDPIRGRCDRYRLSGQPKKVMQGKEMVMEPTAPFKNSISLDQFAAERIGVHTGVAALPLVAGRSPGRERPEPAHGRGVNSRSTARAARESPEEAAASGTIASPGRTTRCSANPVDPGDRSTWMIFSTASTTQ